MINGIVGIYKEKGFTSHDVVAKLRGILGQKKIGHTGTLDPDATGVLPVCLGKGTKLCDLLTEKEKQYRATLRLGVTTDTLDMSGAVLRTSSTEGLTIEQVKEVVESFLGESEQIPPMYSALKVNGKKLYELARQGQVVERKPRRIMISSIVIEEITLPRVVFTVTCSKGTYIRSLCQDIGDKLGCGGAMEELTRTKVDPFTLENCFTLAQIEALKQDNRLSEAIVPIDKMFEHLPSLILPTCYDKLANNGNPLPVESWVTIPLSTEERVRVYEEDGTFLGLYAMAPEKKMLRLVKLFKDINQ